MSFIDDPFDLGSWAGGTPVTKPASGAPQVGAPTVRGPDTGWDGFLGALGDGLNNVIGAASKAGGTLLADAINPNTKDAIERRQYAAQVEAQTDPLWVATVKGVPGTTWALAAAVVVGGIVALWAIWRK